MGTWTIDDAALFQAIIGWGVDAVATNDPALGVSALRETEA